MTPPRALRALATLVPLACAVVGACRRPGAVARDAAPAAPGPAVVRAAPAPDVVAPAPRALAGESGDGAPPDNGTLAWSAPLEARAGTTFAAPLDLVPDGAGGALLVWAAFDPDALRSDVLGWRLDGDGHPVGAPRRLRRTAGEVRAIAASVRGGTAWVAWVSAVGPQSPYDEDHTREGAVLGERVVAAMPARADLSAVAPPRTLRDELVRAAPRMFPGEFVEVSALAGGGAAVLGPGETARCTHTHDGEHGDRSWCVGFGADVLDASGRVVRSEHEQTLTPPEVPRDLVRVEASDGREVLVYARTDDHEWTRTGLYPVVVAAAGAGGAGLPDALLDAMPYWSRVALAWTGRELVAVGYQEGEDLIADERAVRVVRADGSLVTPHITLQDRDESWPWLVGHEVRCVPGPGRLAIRLRWRGGGAFEFDPAGPGASLRLGDWIPPRALPGAAAPADDARALPLAWTGRTLVGVDPAHGELRRWRCSPRGTLVPAP